MFKKSLIGLSIFLLIIVVGVSTVVIKPSLLRGPITLGAQRFAGLDIELDTLESHRAPLRLELSGLRISNPDWPEPTLLTLDRLSLKLIASPFKPGAFWSLESDGLSVNLAGNRDGEFNWITEQLRGDALPPPTEQPEAGVATLPGDFNFQQLVLRNTHIHLHSADDQRHHIALAEIRGERTEVGNGEFTLELAYRQQRFTLSGGIVLFDPTAGILDYQLAIKHPDAQLNSQGRLTLSPDLQGSALQLDVALQSLEQLASLADVTAPPLPPSTLSAQLNITDDYELRTLTLSIGDNRLSGSATLSSDLRRIAATLNSPALDIDALSAALTSDSPPADSAAKDREAETELDWQWLHERQLSARFDIAKLSASGWTLHKVRGELTADRQLNLSLQLAEAQQQATQRHLTDIDAQLQLQPLAKRTRGSDATLSLALRQQQLTLNAEGKVNLNGIAGSQLKISSQAPRSADIWSLALLPWREAGAMRLEAELSSSDQHIQLSANATLGQQQADLDLRYRPGSDTANAKLDGNIALRHLSTDFMSTATPTATPAPTKAKKAAKVFSKEAIATDALRQIDGELIVELLDIDTGYTVISKAKLKPRLRNGVLNLDDSRIYADGGEAHISAQLDASQVVPSLRGQLKIDGSDYGKLGLIKAAGISHGQGKIRIDLNAQGNSPAALAASMAGQIDMKITGLEAKGNALNLIGSDVLTETIDKLNPFSEKRETTQIECLAVHFKGARGKFVSKDGIALETESSKIIGTGHVDLGKEELQFGVSPIARKGVGVNVGAAASLIRLGGTFARPRVEADPGGMFTSGLSTGAAIYTGGLSLVAQGLMKRALYAGSACDGELDEIPAAEELPEELLQPRPLLNPDGSPQLPAQSGGATQQTAAPTSAN